jgi:hypothetical protein
MKCLHHHNESAPPKSKPTIDVPRKEATKYIVLFAPLQTCMLRVEYAGEAGGDLGWWDLNT